MFSLRHIIKLITLLIATCSLSFLLVSYSPIDPVQTYVGADMIRVSPEQRENIAAYWGLNNSRTEQFLSWTKAVLHGNLGTSLIYRAPVLSVIAERFVASLALMGVAWILSGIIGFILGIIAGMREGTIWDRLIKGYCFLLASTPAFWLGLLLLIVFSVWLGWFPVGLASPAGVLAENVSLVERLRHLFLPALTLSILGVANVALHTRQKLVEVLHSEFIRFAKAKGERGFHLLYRHGLRNISLPAVSLHFASFGELFGGAILAEQVFSFPGLGQAIVQAGLGGDVPLLLGIVMFSTLFVFTGNLLADLLYRFIDPRLRRRGGW
ncbi:MULTISPECIES: ABC transporter permease [Lederbergia]|uniref:ABC transporter permease n=2 Tax=Lederbergia TaxID=2804231 RepID=A0A178A349_9BACI|nr:MULTISPECIES: ABC transporter permease [Lederbergia]MBP1916426.1 peptide/nickel transport system permease protein [Lederbergia galactosidilytica]OAK73498.1 ABC transporter permease [Lederbergia galactosidilytica]GIN59469.1 ABC transporter permease [Lederbergia ruris]